MKATVHTIRYEDPERPEHGSFSVFLDPDGRVLYVVRVHGARAPFMTESVPFEGTTRKDARKAIERHMAQLDAEAEQRRNAPPCNCAGRGEVRCA